MQQKLIILAVLVLATSAFTLIQKKTIQTPSLEVIPWPFTVCGNGDWKIQKLAISNAPARNANTDMDIVRFV